MSLIKNTAQYKIRLFTPGPTPIFQHILDIASRQLPYNRTEQFSQITYEILDGLKYLFVTKGDVVIFASSGTGAMEASIFNYKQSSKKFKEAVYSIGALDTKIKKTSIQDFII